MANKEIKKIKYMVLMKIILQICFKAFKTSSAVNNHRVIHTEAKDFKCSTCSFSTNTKGNLRIHERIHSDVYPYACQFCTMKFRTASNMVKHMRNIHEKEKANKVSHNLIVIQMTRLIFSTYFLV